MPIHTAVATLHTNYGDIVVNLFGDHAPRTVQNFIGLVRRTRRVDPPRHRKARRRPALQGRRLPPHHLGLHDPGRRPARPGHRRPGLQVQRRDQRRADLHRARTSSRWPTPDCAATPSPGRPRARTARSSSSRFPARAAAPEWLQGKHTIFGEVADDASKAVVDTIGEVPTAAGDRPIEPVVIESIDVVAV